MCLFDVNVRCLNAQCVCVEKQLKFRGKIQIGTIYNIYAISVCNTLWLHVSYHSVEKIIAGAVKIIMVYRYKSARHLLDRHIVKIL